MELVFTNGVLPNISKAMEVSLQEQRSIKIDNMFTCRFNSFVEKDLSISKICKIAFGKLIHSFIQKAKTRIIISKNDTQ